MPSKVIVWERFCVGKSRISKLLLYQPPSVWQELSLFYLDMAKDFL